ncbi:hypothetical protein HK096_001374, partial [Nowakowskiella sp. JEL0078]
MTIRNCFAHTGIFPVSQESILRNDHVDDTEVLKLSKLLSELQVVQPNDDDFEMLSMVEFVNIDKHVDTYDPIENVEDEILVEVLDEIDVSYIAQENDDGANENENQIEEFIQIYN